ncbi:MAG: fumarylacetoacetate hydrolase family protein [Alphaproteobacteria bacterium]|nr:fumarylacetoacetate hydrolase family protein [Alphaproteobacteria bacterium]MBU6473934.1 fumarylacetoacetate hydrolase family protein [Alphaproteobacteria bacterium]MDE2013182.1 fumarylacetoacetate hydrolase family protein [Alphaproteobacteria bacterium]MDE2073168.1 fumarylacetoacetate hydrolase family protein [Alphaproteobacteria bacterium]
MKRARIAHDGAVVWAEAVENETALRLPNGQRIAATDALFLPPVTPGAAIFALGLNYADHRAELGFKAKEPPLVFLKGQNTLVGHRGATPRPADGNQMHPECELVAIIGTPARHVAVESALSHVAGYTIACDYAIREYLENYYRPNLRVKNRDATTPLGPFVVDAADIGDPQNLKIVTRVNGDVVQQGTTADMVQGVAELIAYLSGFMTLMPGDMILTGTPEGVHFCAAGDRVECEIESIGVLENRLVAAS